jgi:hypothetical protein
MPIATSHACRSGSIDEFGSFLAFDPITKVGLWLGVNQPGIATAIGENITAAALGGTIAAIQARAASDTTLPVKHAQMAGSYHGYVSEVHGNVTIAIAASGEGGAGPLMATFHLPTGSVIPALATPVPGDDAWRLILNMPPLPIPCQLVTEIAVNGETASFSEPSEAGAPVDMFELPGLFPAARFRRFTGTAAASTSPTPEPSASPEPEPAAMQPTPPHLVAPWPDWGRVMVAMLGVLLAIVLAQGTFVIYLLRARAHSGGEPVIKGMQQLS